MRYAASRIQGGARVNLIRENRYRECAMQWAQASGVIYFERLKAEYRTLPLETPGDQP